MNTPLNPNARYNALAFVVVLPLALGRANGDTVIVSPGTSRASISFRERQGNDEPMDIGVCCPPGFWQNIVFVSDCTGDKEIWRMRSDGSDPVQLTSNPGSDTEPVPSPDGRWVAYVSDAGNPPTAPGQCPNTDIWIMRSDGSEPQRLTFYETAYTHQPAWAPDGSRIAFVRECEGMYLGEVLVDLSEPAYDLASGVCRYNPEYRPTGTHLLYDRDNVGSGWWDLWHMQLELEPPEEERLSFWSHSVGSGYSRDGNKIAYIRVHRPVSEVRLMNWDGSVDGLLWDNSAIAYDGWGQVAWSPDDSRIVVTVYPSLYPGVPEFSSFIQLLDAATGDEIYRTSEGRNTFALESSLYSDRRFVAGNMVWNSDGSKIVFMSDRDGNWEIYRMNADGTEQLNLTNTDAWDGSPAWISAPDCHSVPLLDIKPGSCPNAFNPGHTDGRETASKAARNPAFPARHLATFRSSAAAVLPVALLGSDEFDVARVDLGSVRLGRADCVGGTVSPVRTTLEDVATPFQGEPCDCHELGGDGIVDLSMKFRRSTLVEVLELGSVEPGSDVPLVLTGQLLDGCEFTATDCLWLTP